MANLYVQSRKLERLERELREVVQAIDTIAAATDDRRALVAGGHARAAYLSTVRARFEASKRR